MLVSWLTNSEIRQALCNTFVGFHEEAWKFLTRKEDENDESASPVSAYKTACKVEKTDAENKRDADYLEAWKELIATAGGYMAEHPVNVTSGGSDEPADGPAGNQPGEAVSDGEYAQWIRPEWAYEIGELLRPEDRARHYAICLAQAVEADGWDWVLKFREKVLPRGLITVPEVDCFLAEPARRLLPQSEINALNAVVLESTLLEDRCHPLPNGRRRFVGIVRSSQERYSIDHHPAAGRVWSGDPEAFTQGQNQEYASQTYFPGSVFADVMDTADRLANRLTWEHEEAVTFLLTGKVPDSVPFYLSLHHMFPGGAEDGSITFHDLASAKVSGLRMEIPIWLPAEELTALFRHIQKKTLNADNRGISMQYLQLFSFVLTQRRRLGIRGMGSQRQRREIYEAWNLWCSDHAEARKKHPEMEDYEYQWADVQTDWKMEDFTYFNMVCSRVQERLLPAGNK